jgi:CHAT domain-containing protein
MSSETAEGIFLELSLNVKAENTLTREILLQTFSYLSYIRKTTHHPEAFSLLQQTITLHRNYDKKKDLADFMLKYGSIILQEEPLMANDMVMTALGLYKEKQESEVAEELIHTYNLLGQIMLMSGRSAQSIGFYHQALAISKRNNVSVRQRIDIDKSLARIYYQTRQFDSANHYCLALKNRVFDLVNPSDDELSNTYGFVSRYYASKEMFDSALIYRKMSLDIDLKLFPHNSLRVKSGHYAMSELYTQKGDLQKALEIIHKNLQLEYPNSFGTGNVHDVPPMEMLPGMNVNAVLQSLMQKIYLHGLLYQETGDINWLEDERKHYYVMDFYSKTLQGSMVDKNFLAVMQMGAYGYQSTIKSLSNYYSITKNPEIVDDIYLGYQQYQMNAPKAQKSSYEIELQKVTQKINHVKSQMASNVNDSIKQKLNDTLFELHIQTALLKQSIQRSPVPSSRPFNLSQYHASAELLKNSVDGKTALIEYAMFMDSLQIFVFTKGELHYRTVAAGTEYKATLNEYRRSIATGGTMHSKNLTKFLLEPVYQIIANKEKLVIIPDDNLFAIPMEALTIPNSSEILLSKHQVSYHYSGYFWHQSNTYSKTPENPVIALFAPVFNTENSSILASGNPYRGSEILTSEDFFREGEQLQPLPFSEKEVVNIAQMFRAKNFTANAFIGNDASEERLRQQTTADIIHVATHGISNRDIPEHSGLFFTQSTEVINPLDYKNDGFLHLNELYEISLNADLAVLSACKSGVGKIFVGEGFFGLPRGFILAGTKNLIVSLWKIHDEKTANLIERFYNYFLDGQSYAEALRLAKLDMIKEGYLPIDWSGIILIGK